MKAKIYTITSIALFALFVTACGVEGDDSTDNSCPSGCCLPDCDPNPEPTPDPEPVCGDGVCNGSETVESCSEDCAEPTPEPTPEHLACPFKTDGKYNWNFAAKYVSGASKGEVRFFTAHSDGSYPNPKIVDSNSSGYLGMYYEVEEGEYRLSYIGYQYSDECSGNDCPSAWAQYGDKDSVLAKLSPECLAFIQCNWWDADAEKVLTDVECAECSLQVHVDGDGTITGAGNMSNF